MDTVVAGEFQDWEILHSNSDSEIDPHNPFDEIDSCGLIQANYFSLDRPNLVEDVDEASAESGNPSWIDPGLEEDPNRFLHKESAEFWSDSSSERSLNGKNEMGFSESKNKVGEFEKYGEKEESLGQFRSEIEVGSDKVDDFVENSPVNLDESTHITAKGNDHGNIRTSGDIIASGVGEPSDKKKSGGVVERGRRIVWWKLPVEFLKNCVLKMSPMWTVSVAAAVVGFMILGRRLYKMKKKARGIQINVAVDDKKASQVMSRAARLNEAFSIVKRVPIVRPSLPAVGTTPWPVMSLR